MNRRLSLLLDSPDLKELPAPKVETPPTPAPRPARRAFEDLGDLSPVQALAVDRVLRGREETRLNIPDRPTAQAPQPTNETDRLRAMRQAVNPTRPRQQFRIPQAPASTLDRTMTGIDLSEGYTSPLDSFLDE